MDRIDLYVELAAPSWLELKERPRGPQSPAVRERVIEARRRQAYRFRDARAKTNAAMQGQDVRRWCALDGAAESVLRLAVEQLRLSARAVDKILKVARTIADLEGSERLTAAHVQEALLFRAPAAATWAAESAHMHSPSGGGAER